jgi:hypothetical protein
MIANPNRDRLFKACQHTIQGFFKDLSNLLYLVAFKDNETLARILHVIRNDRLGTIAIYLNLIDMHVVDEYTQKWCFPSRLVWMLVGVSCIFVDCVRLDGWRTEYESSIKRVFAHLSKRDN